MRRHAQKQQMNIGNMSFEDAAKFKHFHNSTNSQNYMHEQIMSRLNSGNVCYHSVHSLLSSRLMYRNVKVKIYKTVILPVILYGCENWSLTLNEKHRLEGV
jgi:hypothetical protein